MGKLFGRVSTTRRNVRLLLRHQGYDAAKQDELLSKFLRLPRVAVNELLEFEDGTVGLAMNLDEESIGAVVLGSVDRLEEEQVCGATEDVGVSALNTELAATSLAA